MPAPVDAKQRIAGIGQQAVIFRGGAVAQTEDALRLAQAQCEIAPIMDLPAGKLRGRAPADGAERKAR